MSTKDWQEIDRQVKKELLVDIRLNNFLRSVFPNLIERRVFIGKCLKKLTTRRMLLRAQWYTEIADDMDKIRRNRPALKIVFLFGLAESIVKFRLKNKKIIMENGDKYNKKLKLWTKD